MRILIVAARHPWPARRGDQRRPLEVARLLARGGAAGPHEVTLLALRGPASQVARLAPTPAATDPTDPPALPPAQPGAGEPFTFRAYRRGLRDVFTGLWAALRRGLPLQTALYGSTDLGRQLRALAPAQDLVIFTLARLARHLPDAGDTPVVVDLIDSLALNLARRAAVDRWWLAPLISLETGRLASAETALASAARALVVVADRDRRAILDHARASEVQRGDDLAGTSHRADQRIDQRIDRRVRVIPLAFPSGSPATAAAGHQPQVVLTGNLGYFVNDDAARWLCREVVPELRRARPELRIVFAGDRPGLALRRAAAQAGVAIVASPPDLAAILAQSTIALAPMRAGSGQPIKIMEAWAQGVPVVASPWAASGTTGEAGTDFLVADTPAEWVAAILRLLDTPILRSRLAAAGRARLASDYAPERIAAAWLALAGEIADTGRSADSATPPAAGVSPTSNRPLTAHSSSSP